MWNHISVHCELCPPCTQGRFHPLTEAQCAESAQFILPASLGLLLLLSALVASKSENKCWTNVCWTNRQCRNRLMLPKCEMHPLRFLRSCDCLAISRRANTWPRIISEDKELVKVKFDWIYFPKCSLYVTISTEKVQLVPRGSMLALPLWLALPRQQKTQSKHRLIAPLVRRVMTDKGQTRANGHFGVGPKSVSV